MNVSERVAEIIREDPRADMLFGLIRNAAQIEGASKSQLREALSRAALDLLATNKEAQAVIMGTEAVHLN